MSAGNRPLRVVQRATGVVGCHALAAILAHPDLELIGARVYSPDKAGRDVGELCGLGRTGVSAPMFFDSMGFGRPPDADVPLANPALVGGTFRAPILLVADGLGASIEDFADAREVAVAEGARSSRSSTSPGSARTRLPSGPAAEAGGCASRARRRWRWTRPSP